MFQRDSDIRSDYLPQPHAPMNDASFHVFSLSSLDYLQYGGIAFAIIGAVIYEIILRRKEETEIQEIISKAEQKRKKEEKASRMFAYQQGGMPGLIKHKDEYLRQEKTISDKQFYTATAHLSYDKYLSRRQECLGDQWRERERYENSLKEWVTDNLGPEKSHHYEWEIKYGYEEQFNNLFVKNDDGMFELLKQVEFFLEEMNRKLRCPYWELSKKGGVEGLRCYDKEVLTKRNISFDILTAWGKQNLQPEQLKNLKASQDNWLTVKENEEIDRERWREVLAEEGAEGIFKIFKDKILEINDLYDGETQWEQLYHARIRYCIKLSMWTEMNGEEQLPKEFWRILD